MKENIQHPTFNTERPGNLRRGRFIERWAMNIECSVLLLFAFFSWSALGQTNTNALPALSPPYGELPPTFWEQHGTTIISSGVVVLALVTLAIWMRLRPRPPVILPPAEQARQALQILRHRPEDGALLSVVSAILRKYFVAAFQLSPGEFTTTEFCLVISRQEQIGVGLSAKVAEFLSQCDERKFGPVNPTIPLGAISRALELVRLAEEHRSQLRQSAAAPTQHAVPTVR